jgi:diaminopimelate epimerase
MKLPFSKWHALGNDFLIVDGRILSLPWERIAPLLAHRQIGIGCDQVLVIEPSDRAHVRMRIFNRDGSQAEMCGNGIRALAAHLFREGEGSSPIAIETMAGIYEISRNGEMFRVSMGFPRFLLKDIGADAGAFLRSPEDRAYALSLDRWPEPLRKASGYGVSMGNPHLVFFLDTIEGIPLESWGRALEVDPAFPERINVEFVAIVSPQRIRARIWERGAGATLACGTGATASAVIAIAEKGLHSPVEVELALGTLRVGWKEGEPAWLEGPVSFVGEGMVDLTTLYRWEGVIHGS